MRFAGITETSRAKAYMRMFRDQLLFAANGTLNEPREEGVLHFAGGEWDRLSRATMIDIYLRTVSIEKLEFNWKSLVGIQTTSFKLDTDSLNSLIQESLPHLDPTKQYASARWHDFLIILVMLRLFPKDAEPYRVAATHYHALNRLNPSFAEWYRTFNSQRWA